MANTYQRMIDYIQMLIPIAHNPLPAGAFVSVDHQGQVEYESVKSLDHQGSWETSIRFRSQGALDDEGRATLLFIKGNPAKFLQGHNVFGTTDIYSLARRVLESAREPLGLPHVPDDVLRSSVISRIDLTYSISFESPVIAQAYIKQVSLRACTRSGRPIARGASLAFQPSSNRYSVVVYHKGDELKSHPLPETLPCKGLIESDASKLVRVEVRLKTNELKERELRTLEDWTKADIPAIYQDYVRRIAMNTEAQIPTEEIQNINRCYRDSYFMWDNGIDLQSVMSQNTFYRHRRELMNYGIDIAIPKEPTSTAKIIPLTRAIEGQPYQIPSYAHQFGLIVSKAA